MASCFEDKRGSNNSTYFKGHHIIWNETADTTEALFHNCCFSAERVPSESTHEPIKSMIGC